MPHESEPSTTPSSDSQDSVISAASSLPSDGFRTPSPPPARDTQLSPGSTIAPDSPTWRSPKAALKPDEEEKQEEPIISYQEPPHCYQALAAGYLETYYATHSSGLWRYNHSRLPLFSEFPLLRQMAATKLKLLHEEKEAVDRYLTMDRTTKVEKIESEKEKWLLFFSLVSNATAKASSEYLMNELFFPADPLAYSLPSKTYGLKTKSTPNLLPMNRMVRLIQFRESEKPQCITRSEIPHQTEIPKLMKRAQKELERLQAICVFQDSLWEAIEALSNNSLSNTQRSTHIATLLTPPSHHFSLLTEAEIRQICGPIKITPQGISFKTKRRFAWVDIPGSEKIHPKKVRESLLYHLMANRIFSFGKEKERLFELYKKREEIKKALDKFCNPALDPPSRKAIYDEHFRNLLTEAEISHICGPIEITPDGVFFRKKQKLTLTVTPIIYPEEKRNQLLYLLMAKRKLETGKEKKRFTIIYNNREAIKKALSMFCNPKLHSANRKIQYYRPLTTLTHSPNLLTPKELSTVLHPNLTYAERVSMILTLCQERFDPSTDKDKKAHLELVWETRESLFEAIKALTNPMLSDNDRRENFSTLQHYFSDTLISLLCSPQYPNSSKDETDASPQIKSRRQKFDETLEGVKREAERITIYITYLQNLSKENSWIKASRNEAAGLYQEAQKRLPLLGNEIALLDDALFALQNSAETANKVIEETIKKLAQMKARFQSYYKKRYHQEISIPELDEEILSPNNTIIDAQRSAKSATKKVEEIKKEINALKYTKARWQKLHNDLEKLYPDFVRPRTPPTAFFSNKLDFATTDHCTTPPPARTLTAGGAE